MQRVLIRKPGGYDRLELVTEPDRQPGPGEVAVSVRAIGINYADCVVRMGLYSSAKKYLGFPMTPGFDFAGEVEAVGEGVTEFRPGERVLGVTRFGAYQTQIVVPVHQLYAIPEGWSYSRAAAFPTVHLTAWYALCEQSRARPGKKVLVHTAAGGVGTAALAICKRLAMKSYAVVGTPNKRAVALTSGADHVVVRSEGDYWAKLRELVPEGFDIVLEASGVTTQRQSYRHLRPTGRMIVFGMGTLLPSGGKGVNWLSLAARYLTMPWYNPLQLLDDNKTVAAFNLSYLFGEKEALSEAMNELLGWAREGALPEPPITEFPLSEVRAAHEALESTKTVGKLVLVVR